MKVCGLLGFIIVLNLLFGGIGFYYCRSIKRKARCFLQFVRALLVCECARVFAMVASSVPILLNSINFD